MRVIALLASLTAIAVMPVAAQTTEEAQTPAIAAFMDKSSFEGDVEFSEGISSYSFSSGIVGQTPKSDKDLNLWRWASVTKQVIAVIVMQEVAAGRIDLDKPISTYLPRFKSPSADKITVRQLLRHQSGLPNPDDAAPTSETAAAFYRPEYKGNRDPLTGYCAGKPKGAPDGNWAYNNCDYMVAGALLEAVTKTPWRKLINRRIAKPLGSITLGTYPTRRWTRPGKIKGQPEPAIDLASFGASAGLYGTTNDMIAFDRALISGKLLPKIQLDIMWDGKPELGFIALGQWVFDADLKGCAKPIRIIERRGAIGGVQVRNFIMPDRNAALVAFTFNGDFDFGEIWQGSGFAHDLLNAALCAQK
jgi:D-alanyl-D-alanine carboxypeptidase